MSQNLLNSPISRFSRNEKKKLYTNARFMALPGHEGERFSKFKTKNAKIHAISLLQMQGSPQSNIRKEIRFLFQRYLKAIENHFKTKNNPNKVSLLP
jgi:hypothetical protein